MIPLDRHPMPLEHYDERAGLSLVASADLTQLVQITQCQIWNN